MKPISIVIPYSLSMDALYIYGQIRKEDGHLNGTFEFPGGKVEDGENAHQAALREFKEEVGVALDEVSLFTHHRYDYDDRSVLLIAYVTEYTSEMSLIREKISFDNVQNDVEKLNIPQANHTIIMRLIEHFIRERNI